LSRGPLFDPRVLEQYLQELRGQPIPQETQRVEAVADWIRDLRAGTATKETSLEQVFNHQILANALGYEIVPSENPSAWAKPTTKVTGLHGEPDVVLGSYLNGHEPRFTAVLELKSPGTNLDAPQSRVDPKTPVQQAFEYGERILGVEWVLVSDMKIIRLYSVESPHDALTFDLEKCAAGGRHFRELYGLISYEQLVAKGPDASTARLLAKSASRQLEIRDSFYEAYYKIRLDLLTAIYAAVKQLPHQPSRLELLASVQRLLDRMLFIYYCEDTPQRLLPQNTVRDVTQAARLMPGPSDHKVYDALKALFREIDAGSPPASQQQLPGYNGELFKFDAVIDAIDLPDTLHDYEYIFDEGDKQRRIQGAWGLYAYDFWRELNEHLLGHIFEQSLSDQIALADDDTIADKMGERKRRGIYYTSQILADFLANSALEALLGDEPATPNATQSSLEAQMQTRQDRLGQLKVIDLACGSGAFLVSSYHALLRELWTAQDAIESLRGNMTPDLFSRDETITQSVVLRDTLHGCDLLPQAVEIAKLALWLRSARKGEKVANLSANLVSGDSLAIHRLLSQLSSGLGTYDLVLGNPPWGGEVEPAVYEEACATLDLEPEPRWDSWELFLHLGLAFLRPGGRLALVLPDTFFSPIKDRSRRRLLEAGTVEKVHDLGIDWFADVRMGTVLVQARRGTVPIQNDIRTVLLSGGLRRRAIEGKVPLSQIETQLGRDVPQEACIASPRAEIEVFRSRQDSLLMERMIERSTALSDLCTRGRGEEINKAGLLWVCQSCFTANVPGTKVKRDPASANGLKYKPKICTGCGLSLDETNTVERFLVEDLQGAATNGRVAPYIDGDDLTRRYGMLSPGRVIRLDLAGFPYKDSSFYREPKILIRKTGVGLMAALDVTGVRFPQTVFYYRLRPEAEEEGYDHEFVLAALLSRTMTYFLFKRYGQVDPARGHAHVTHERLKALPIPHVDFADADQKRLYDDVVTRARRLIGGESIIGSPDDMQIDVALRTLWGLDPDDGLYINLELAQVPDSQAMRDLFPGGMPKRILEGEDAVLKVPTPVGA